MFFMRPNTTDRNVKTISTLQLCFQDATRYDRAWEKVFPHIHPSVHVYNPILPWGTPPFDKNSAADFLTEYFQKPTVVTRITKERDRMGYPIAVFEFTN